MSRLGTKGKFQYDDLVPIQAPRDMTETLRLKLSPKTASKLRRLAVKRGENLESLVQQLLDELSAELKVDDDQAQLSDEQVKDLRKRARNPGPFATPKEVAAVLSKFK
jgi:hypothetical protein